MVDLELLDKKGNLLSENRYWLSNSDKDRQYLAFNKLPNVELEGDVFRTGDTSAMVTVSNPSDLVALSIKLNLRNAASDLRILPAYFDDGYFTLLPGESRSIALQYPTDKAPGKLKVTAEGYNIKRIDLGIL
jgi:hypothetical protein